MLHSILSARALSRTLAVYAAYALLSACVVPAAIEGIRSEEQAPQPEPTPVEGTGDAGVDGGGSDHPSCFDQEQGEQETDTDCGGSLCARRCEAGQDCRRGSDCQSGVCDGVCLRPQCDDEVKNGEESDIDCGGDCSPCTTNLACSNDSDCASRRCEAGRCESGECQDGRMNGLETDADCGGELCEVCQLGMRCVGNADCESGYCSALDNTCRPAECSDGLLSEGESSLDCGGRCAGCQPGEACRDNADCESAICNSEQGVCQASTCFDEERNGGEIDKDCGGETGCPRCLVGRECEVDSDCNSNTCHDLSEGGEGELRCVAVGESCGDSRLNGNETDVDCGGKECPACHAGEACLLGSDCATADCATGRCAESALDGPCSAASDCVSDNCSSDGCQPGYAGAECTSGDACKSGECLGGLECSASSAGMECQTDEHCVTGGCAEDGYCSLGAAGDGCRSGEDCRSGACAAELCSAMGFDEVCIEDQDCLSLRCDGTCEVSWAGEACLDDTDCGSVQCKAGLCSHSGAGGACQVSEDCLSSDCSIEGSCGFSAVLEGCARSEDCINHNCIASICEGLSTGSACEADSWCDSLDCREQLCVRGGEGLRCHAETDCVSQDCLADGTCGSPSILYSDACPAELSNDPQIVFELQNKSSHELNASDYAVLYYLTAESPISEVRSYGTSSTWRFEEGVLIVTDTSGGVVGLNSSREFDVRYHANDWASFDTTNDYSVSDCGGDNSRVVVCRRVAGLWYVVFGIPPEDDSLVCDRL